MKPAFFETPAAFRKWLAKHHATATELLVGFYRKGSGRPSITWPESVDQALCFGWIDGVRKSLDDDCYTIRFSPRTAKSNWSAINIKRARELIDAGLMQPAGLKAFQERSKTGPLRYSYEQRRDVSLDKQLEKRFRAQRSAWRYFQAQPPSYRTIVVFWIMNGKRPDTRERRLARAIEASTAEERIDLMKPYGTAKKRRHRNSARKGGT